MNGTALIALACSHQYHLHLIPGYFRVTWVKFVLVLVLSSKTFYSAIHVLPSPGKPTFSHIPVQLVVTPIWNKEILID